MAISLSKFVTITSKRTSSATVISGFNALMVCAGDSSVTAPLHGTFTTDGGFTEWTHYAKLSGVSKEAGSKFFSAASGSATLHVVIVAGTGTGTTLDRIKAAVATITDPWKIGFSADYQQSSAVSNSITEDGASISSVTADWTTFAAKVNQTDGTYVFTAEVTTGASPTTTWKLNGNAVVLTEYGITIEGTAADGDTLTAIFYARPSALLSEFNTAVTAVEGAVSLAAVTKGAYADAVTALATYKGDFNVCFACKVPSDAAYIPAILCSTDYSNAIKNYCFTQISGAVPYVTDNAAYEALVGANINFIGLVKTYSKDISFLQMGVSGKGYDLVSYFGQMWMEAYAGESIMSLFASTTLTAGNAIGYIKGALATCCAMGISNGVIVRGKLFSDTKKAEINSIAGVDGAADAVSTDGMWYDVTLQESGGAYQANYVLIYADATTVKKVSGVHYLV